MHSANCHFSLSSINCSFLFIQRIRKRKNLHLSVTMMDAWQPMTPPVLYRVAGRFTRPIQELALSHVSDVQSLEQQHQVAEVFLHHPWTVDLPHPFFIQSLWIQTDTQP